MIIELKDIIKNYFNYFSNKDIEKLKNLFSNNIRLKDWDIDAKGIDNVLDANKKIFDSVDTIVVSPINIYQDNMVLLCEINILINNAEKLNVIDIIKFNKDKKIIEISAFKQ